VRNQVAIRWARKPWLAALLLVALGSRVLIPAGFMPGPGGLVLCSGHGPMIMSMPSDMAGMDMSNMDMSGMDMTGMVRHGSHPSHHGGSPGHEGTSLCPFAAAATAMAGGHNTVIAGAVAAASGPVLLPFRPFVPRNTMVPTRLPRGPPTFA